MFSAAALPLLLGATDPLARLLPELGLFAQQRHLRANGDVGRRRLALEPRVDVDAVARRDVESVEDVDERAAEAAEVEELLDGIESHLDELEEVPPRQARLHHLRLEVVRLGVEELYRG